MRTAISGLLWVSLAPLFYSAMSSSAKLAGAHLSVWQIGVGRFGLGLVLVPIIVRLLGINLWGRQRFLLTIRGLCGAIAFLLLVAALQRIPLSLAMVLFYLYPAFTALLSPWLAGEPTNKEAWPFIIGAFFGTTLTLWPVDFCQRNVRFGPPLRPDRFGDVRYYSTLGPHIRQGKQHLYAVLLPLPRWNPNRPRALAFAAGPTSAKGICRLD